jgi:thiol-disulfide isomerase/thioredoxin
MSTSPPRSPWFALLAAVALAAAGPSRADEPSRLVPAAGPVKVGTPFPTFAGFDLDGTLVSSRALFKPGLAAPPVVVSFFATWCKPCERHLPELARVAAKAGARVVLVSFGDEEPGAVRAFLAPAGVKDATVIADRTLAIAGRVGVNKALPRTFVVDGAGKVAAVFELEGDDFEPVLARELARAAAPVAPAAQAR